MTTSKASAALAPCAVGLTSWSMTFSSSMTEPSENQKDHPERVVVPPVRTGVCSAPGMREDLATALEALARKG
jgi:hypothetical protein